MRLRGPTLALLIALVCEAPIGAQLAAPNGAGVAMGHIHLSARDIETTRQMFVALGGTPVTNETLQMIQFPGVMVLVRQADVTGGTGGSVVNHFSFSVKDIRKSIASWRAAGGTIETTGRSDQAWLTTPDGARVEITEDPSITHPIRLHHIHFNVAAVTEMQAWYAKHFGATPGLRGSNQSGNVPGVDLIYGKVAVVNAGTRGRALDHIGFEVKNLAQFVERLAAEGVKTEAPIRMAANGKVAVAYITDPWGTYVELTQGLAP